MGDEPCRTRRSSAPHQELARRIENLRNPSEKVAYTITKVDIPLGNDVAEAIANYTEGISRSSDKPQAYFEKQTRKYLKERSWEREEGREM